MERIVVSVTAVGGSVDSLDRLKGRRGPQSVLSRIILCLEKMTSVMLSLEVEIWREGLGRWYERLKC